jgi:hypothetical protein
MHGEHEKMGRSAPPRSGLREHAGVKVTVRGQSCRCTYSDIERGNWLLRKKL